MMGDVQPANPTTAGLRRSSAGARLLAALPTLAFLSTFGFFFVDKSTEARTVAESGRGLLTVAVILVGYVAVAFTVRRFVAWSWVPPVVLTGAVLGLAAWIVRPYYVDETANRRLVAGPVRDATATTGAGVPPSGVGTGAQPTRISSGALHGLGHGASGRASIIRNADGSLVVRFETFDIEGTPDPRVYLVEGEDAQRPSGVALGRLEGNRGSVLDYPVPAAGARAGAGWTVLVWCERFAVPIAGATQSPP